MGGFEKESEAIEVLNKLLSDVTEQVAKEDTGACVYTAGSKVYCAVLTKANCDTLSGTWTKDGKCPGT